MKSVYYEVTEKVFAFEDGIDDFFMQYTSKGDIAMCWHTWCPLHAPYYNIFASVTNQL